MYIVISVYTATSIQGGKWVITFRNGNTSLDSVWIELVSYQYINVCVCVVMTLCMCVVNGSHWRTH